MYRSACLLLALLCSQATPAQEVNLYSARNEALIKPLLERFTETTGIKVNLVTGNADALIKRLQLEGRNSPADLLLTVDVARLHRAKAAGLLRPIESSVLESLIPEAYRDPEGHWFGISLRSRVIVYSLERVNPEQLSTYAALTEAQWKGRLCVRSSSNVYNQSLVASMVARQGVAETQKWASGLVSNFGRSPNGGDRDQIKAITAGQCDIALVNTYYLAGMLESELPEERGAARQVAVFWPDQQGHGAHINISGAGISRAAKNPDEARALLEFMVNRESQYWYAETNYEFPVRTDVEPSDLLKSWGEFKADDIGLEKLGIHNAEAVMLMDRAGWR